MEPTKKFLTKTGYCHVLKDRIVFTPRGFMGLLGDITVEGRIHRVLLVFSLLTLFILYFAYVNYLDGELFWAGLFGAIGLYLIYGIFKGWNTSIHPIIERAKIEEVKFIKAIQGLNPPSFEVKFHDPKGKLKKRIITLPNPTTKNRLAVQQAINIMREEELIE